MKILQVSNFFKPSWETGGVTKVNYEISKNLTQRGHDVTVYTTDGFSSRLDVPKNKATNVDGIRVYYFYNLIHSLAKKMKITTPYYLPFVLRKEIKKFDIIHIHEHRTFLAVIVHYYAKKHGIPYVLQSHGSVQRIIEKKGLKYLFDIIFGYNILRNASKVIAVSNVEVDQYIEMDVSKDKIVIVPNGIDFDLFNDLPEAGTFRKKHGVSEKHIILFLGRLHERKGIDFLIRSFAELRKKRSNIKLVLAGNDDGFRSKAEILIYDLNISNDVIFLGYVNTVDKISAYIDADVLVYPSTLEIFGIVPFEAIMCNTPVIVTNDCGCGNFINDADCGYLVKYGDVNDLCRKMETLIEFPEEGDNMVYKGKKYVTIHFAYDKIIEQVEYVYNEV